MKRPQSPQEKKELAYTHDHYVIAENPHRFLRSWPKKKKLTNQAFRRKVRQALISAPEPTSVEEVAQRASTVRREQMHAKWGVVNLRERVAWRLRVRRNRLAFIFFKSPYESEIDRAPFIQLLETLIKGQGGDAIENARIVSDWLAPPTETPSWLRDPRRRPWLAAFFADEPEWRVRLANWVARIVRKPDAE